jgi:hypothetical protein
MVFGTISLQTSDQIIQKCPLKDVDITGRQVYFFSSFSIKITFQHEGNSIPECKYIFPIDFKICIYWTRFILDDEEIENPRRSERTKSNSSYWEISFGWIE